MKINILHAFTAAAAVGFGHYGLTGFEDGGVSFALGADALIGATALFGVVVAHERINRIFRKPDDNINTTIDLE